MNINNIRKHVTLIGPGGWKCSCCAPAPGKSKKQFCKLAKKREAKVIEKIIKEELANL